jgi:hypothetical protein
VIPVLDRINEHFATVSADNMHNSTDIRSALAIGKRTLNRYYNKTDQSEIYHIAMGKFQCFSNLHS